MSPATDSGSSGMSLPVISRRTRVVVRPPGEDSNAAASGPLSAPGGQRARVIVSSAAAQRDVTRHDVQSASTWITVAVRVR